VLAVLVVSVVVVVLDNTVLTVALPRIQQELGASQSQQEWLIATQQVSSALPTSNAATCWMIWSRSRVSSSTPASLGSDQQRSVTRRSRRATGESDPRAQGNREGPRRGSQHPAYQRPPTTKDIRRQRATAPIFIQERAPPTGRHRGLSGIFADRFIQRGTATHQGRGVDRGYPLGTGIVRPMWHTNGTASKNKHVRRWPCNPSTTLRPLCGCSWLNAPRHQ
jgi:hypothetical protein